MSASFGEEIASGLKTTKTCWSVDAVYRDVSGTATMTAAETEKVNKILSAAGALLQKIKPATLNGVANNNDTLMRTKTFVNTKIRAGEKIRNTRMFVKDL